LSNKALGVGFTLTCIISVITFVAKGGIFGFPFIPHVLFGILIWWLSLPLANWFVEKTLK